tara:strand:- start:291 stop:809 length:519 start_codon:yes stop_codon:yes gene_type:complete
MSNLENKQQGWQDTLEVLKGLYPRWQVTTQQLMAWKEQFGMCNQEWLQEACTQMYSRWTGENPKPKWLAESFRQIRAGHQGIPLCESSAAESQSQKESREWELHVLECESDRQRSLKIMQGLDKEERTKWAKVFSKRFPMMSETNDVEDMSTWSKTFCSFVCVYRRMQMQAS